MAFMDKLGQIANKVGDVAGDTLDYGKAKGKIVLEKGKIKDAKEALGNYVYKAVKEGGHPENDRIMAFCAEIDAHLAEIEKLQADAKQSGQDISDAFDGGDKE
ncbi:MAG: hypothetical protein PUK54_05995 [Firmicutes bacterium]|nr:hypothetical protein [Bacillota bacterium]MDD7602141.1 hypothetical protein [Bacillota bacterium]MDY5856984.1 hypothetical protein [Anaerovoracaceae bacterium]